MLLALWGLASGVAAAGREATARSTTEFLQILKDGTAGCSGESFTVRLAAGVALGASTVRATGTQLPLTVPTGCTLKLGEPPGVMGRRQPRRRRLIRPPQLPQLSMLVPIPVLRRGRWPAGAGAGGFQ